MYGPKSRPIAISYALKNKIIEILADEVLRYLLQYFFSNAINVTIPVLKKYCNRYCNNCKTE